MREQTWIRKLDYFRHDSLTIIPMIVAYDYKYKFWLGVWANGTKEERDDLFDKAACGEISFEKLVALGYSWDKYVMIGVILDMVRVFDSLEAPNPITDVQMTYEKGFMLHVGWRDSVI